MNKNTIQEIMEDGIFPFDNDQSATLIETSISYVILKGAYAYKIKKDIHLSFLDFSSLSYRKFYCEEELRLNKRLSGDMYLNVLPISNKNGLWTIGNQKPEALEYAVLMKRMDPNKQLNVLLKKGTVQKRALKKLGKAIAKFHLNEKSLIFAYDPFFLSTEFADIIFVKPIIKQVLGEHYAFLIDQCIQLSNTFIKLQQHYIKKRMENGFFKECHGDLHARNIFLYKEPLVFDCVEFRKEFRQIDVLNEIAFLCMDLETAGYKKLSNAFLDSYHKHTDYPFGKEERLLFTYFKAYRACIRAKVTAVALAQDPKNNRLKDETETYITAMTTYLIAAAAKL